VRSRILSLTLVLAVAGSLATVLSGTPAATAKSASGRSCGFWRWSQKTLSDSAAARVDYHPLSRKITYLRRLSPPSDVFTWGPYKSRTYGVERHTYRIKAKLVGATRESDSDIHLVVAAPAAPSKTMIIEFPDTACSGAVRSAHRSAMKTARSRFLADCGSIGSGFTRLAGTATITGVGFWDDVHGQTGVAPNGLELHPVLAYAGSCSRATGGGGGGGGGSTNCTPGYSPCLPEGPSDYDCYGGGGDGPAYTQSGVVYRVTGSDPYRLDSDGDGYGCE
jgi:hypothetical protein